MIPFLLGLTFSILLTLVFAITGLFLISRWGEIYVADSLEIGEMKVPTFYSTKNDGGAIGFVFLFPVVGVIFGGIHCAGWFFYFPSSDEAMLWRVSSAVLTGSPVLILILTFLLLCIFDEPQMSYFGFPVLAIVFLAYVVSRLLLLVEAFISLRHLTPGMLALVKWTSFIPHI